MVLCGQHQEHARDGWSSKTSLILELWICHFGSCLCPLVDLLWTQRDFGHDISLRVLIFPLCAVLCSALFFFAPLWCSAGVVSVHAALSTSLPLRFLCRWVAVSLVLFCAGLTPLSWPSSHSLPFSGEFPSSIVFLFLTFLLRSAALPLRSLPPRLILLFSLLCSFHNWKFGPFGCCCGSAGNGIHFVLVTSLGRPSLG